MERTLFDGLAADELVQLLLLEVEERIVTGRHRVDDLIFHVELRHCKHCMRTRQTRDAHSIIRQHLTSLSFRLVGVSKHSCSCGAE